MNKIIVGAVSGKVIKLKEKVFEFPTLKLIYKNLPSNWDYIFPTQSSLISHLQQLKLEGNRKNFRDFAEALLDGVRGDGFDDENEQMWQDISDGDFFGDTLWLNLEELISVNEGDKS